MKKKVLSLVLAAAMVLSMTACAKKPAGDDAKKAETEGAELALITDVGTIDDKSFNQGSWEGLKKYADENNISVKYYKPAEKSTEACLTAIDLAVQNGAKLIVTPGFLFEAPVFQAQDKYPDIKFVLLDAAPKENWDKPAVVKENVSSIFYAEEQAGYLAGYAAVTEGHKNLGFMGGIAVPAVVRFGYGFIQGADAAAKDLGVSDVNIKYTYVGNFEATPENQTKAAAWFKEGTDCIFACGGAVGNSVMKAAETSGKVVIGVDVDQSNESSTVITSAMKNLTDSVYNAVKSFYDKKFEGGKSVVLDAAKNGVLLPMESSKFKKFDQAKYDELFNGLVEGSIKVGNDTIAEAPDKVPTEIVKVENIQ